ncbi:MAG: hypothetical protein IH986_04990 [Planctomycetes bacterium]|nr:hypothetical protein [Planctomycetota bacterium]
MKNRPFETLCVALLRAGWSPRYVRRYVAELSDHYESLAREYRADGLCLEQAQHRARKRIGDDASLFESVLVQRRFQSFARRRPWVAFVLLPIPIAFLAKVLAGLALAGGGLLVASVAGAPAHETSPGPPTWYVHFPFAYGVPLLVAVGYCLIAHRRCCSPNWALAACAILAVYVGGVTFQLDSTLLDAGFVRIGYGRHVFSPNARLLIPPLVFAAYFGISRRLGGISAAKAAP